MLSRCNKARTVVPVGIESGSPLTMTSMLCDMILGYRRSAEVSTRGRYLAWLYSRHGVPRFDLSRAHRSSPACPRSCWSPRSQNLRATAAGKRWAASSRGTELVFGPKRIRFRLRCGAKRLDCQGWVPRSLRGPACRLAVPHSREGVSVLQIVRQMRVFVTQCETHV